MTPQGVGLQHGSWFNNTSLLSFKDAQDVIFPPDISLNGQGNSDSRWCPCMTKGGPQSWLFEPITPIIVPSTSKFWTNASIFTCGKHNISPDVTTRLNRTPVIRKMENSTSDYRWFGSYLAFVPDSMLFLILDLSSPVERPVRVITHET